MYCRLHLQSLHHKGVHSNGYKKSENCIKTNQNSTKDDYNSFVDIKTDMLSEVTRNRVSDSINDYNHLDEEKLKVDKHNDSTIIKRDRPKMENETNYKYTECDFTSTYKTSL